MTKLSAHQCVIDVSLYKRVSSCGSCIQAILQCSSMKFIFLLVPVTLFVCIHSAISCAGMLDYIHYFATTIDFVVVL